MQDRMFNSNGEKLSCESRTKPIEEYFQLEKEKRQPAKKKEEAKKAPKTKMRVKIKKML